jgi:phage tail tape-measure protein
MDIFDSFRRDIYGYISQVASFAREGLIEIQRSVMAQQEDTESLRDYERQSRELRLEQENKQNKPRQKGDLIRTIKSGVSDGLGLLTFLGIGTAAAAITAALTMTPEQIQQLGKSIDEFVDKVKNIANAIAENAELITAIVLGLATFLAGTALIRNRSTPAPNQRPTGPRNQSSPSNRVRASSPLGRAAAAVAGAAAAGGAVSATGAGGAVSATGAGGARPSSVPETGTRPPPATPPEASRPPPATPPEASRPPPATPPGSPDRAPPQAPASQQAQSGAPERESKHPKPKRAIRIAAGSAVDVIFGAVEIKNLIEQRNAGDISEEEFKSEVVKVLGSTVGSMAGAAAGGFIGSALGPIGTFLGAMGGAYVGSSYGEEIATALYNSYLSESEDMPDDYNEQAARAARIGANLQTRLSERRAELRQQEREKNVNIEQMTNLTDRAVSEGRITSTQARQIEEIGSSQGADLRAGDIELAIEQLQAARDGAATAETLKLGLSGGRTGRVIVLPPQSIPSQGNARRNRPPERPSQSNSSQVNRNGLQTRNPDNALNSARDHVGWSSNGE